MNTVSDVSRAINSHIIKAGSKIYCAGNASTPQDLLAQLARDTSIRDVEIYSVLLLGEKIKPLMTEERCRNITHRVIFSSHYTREAINKGWAKYHPIHLMEIPRHVKYFMQPNVVFVGVSGPDKGGNYSLGTTVEGVYSAIKAARRNGGIVIAERNKQMPFVLGTTIRENQIDFLYDSDYPLPISPTKHPDELAQRIGKIITALYIDDGCTLQYGIGEVPEAVTESILQKGVSDLGIHTELFASAMIRLVKKGVVTNRFKRKINFSISSIFLSEDVEGYKWFDNNSSIQSRPCDYTNNVFRIAEQPKMVTINSAIGIDLHGNIWADSLDARKIYSGVGGQCDFIRGAQFSEGGMAIIALKSQTKDGISKVVDTCPAGITTTASPSDQVIIVTEFGTVDPRGLSLGERAIAIAHLAAPDEREKLLKKISDNPAFHRPRRGFPDKPRGFTSYEEAVKLL